MSPAAAGALLHMLGLDAEHRDPWRNHYVTDAADAGIAELVAAGLVVETDPPGFLSAGDRVFMATDAGRGVARAENARRNPPPGPRKARYLAWLRLSDVRPDLTFGEFLRRRMYDDPALVG